MDKILLTGADGMLGKNIISIFAKKGILIRATSRKDLDLENFEMVRTFLHEFRPTAIIHCAALVGGIKSNIDGGKSILVKNTLIDNSILFSARELEVPKLIYIGSSCMYPANRPSLLTESDLLSGPLEPTNESYGIAKLQGTKLVEAIAAELGLAWKTFIAPNLFGPHDHFDSEGSHLVAAVISKVKAAMETGERYVEMWGDGTPRREFLFTPDLALWIVNSLNNLSDYPEIMNIGYGEDFSIRDFYEMIIRMFNRNLQIRSNPSMPSGNRQKLMDSSLAISYGWNPNTPIELGIEKTISWYKENAQ